MIDTAMPINALRAARTVTVPASAASSGLVTLAIVLWALLSSDQYQHWFLIPCALSGVLIGIDAVDWFRGRLDVFDPIGILGVFGYHFFFLAPILHVQWDYWMLYVEPPGDWRPWVGRIAVLNVLGLLVYRATRQIPFERLFPSVGDHVWRLRRPRFWQLLACLLLLTAALQTVVYLEYGGISGYVAAFESGTDAFVGRGLQFAISESFPILAMMGYAVYARSSGKTRSWIEIGLVVTLFLALKFLFGGLRGSRSNTIWGIFWAMGLVHLMVRPVSRKLILAGMIPMIVFMFAYGYYKSYGVDGIEDLRESERPIAMIMDSDSSRSLKSTLLLDFGRIDVQAYLIYRTTSSDVEETYTFAHGRTYLGSAALLIPRSIWPDRPDTKVRWGTDVLHGDGVYKSGAERSSRVFGLAGETILNFGFYYVPVAFTILGLLVGWVHRSGLSWTMDDARILMYPMLVNLCIIVMTADSDNVIHFIVKNGLVPTTLIVASVWPVVRNRSALP